MLNPCPRRVLCPPGTGTDSPGVNYSSEHVDVPEFRGIYWPPTPYGFYTACQGRCISTISQLDANLCAQRLAKICLNENTNGKPTYGNTLQICNMPSTGRTVIIQPDTYLADSVAEANAMALSAANEQQQDPNTPPGVTVDPPPTGGGSGNGPVPPNVIPIPVPVPKKPTPPPPASTCKPCDDTVAVDSFVLDFNLPADSPAVSQDSPRLKCGSWQFCINTVAGGPVGYNADVTLTAISSGPAETLQWSETMFSIDCTSDPACLTPADTAAFGLHGCCGTTCNNPTGYLAICEESGLSGYLTKIRAYYQPSGEFMPPRHFTITGTLISPP